MPLDILTGEGLAEALDGAEVVVDVSNAPAWDDAAVMDFFLTSSRNILTAETAAGISHHVALSVVGTDRLPESGYFRAKLAQEEAIKPATVLTAGGASLAGNSACSSLASFSSAVSRRSKRNACCTCAMTG